MAWRPAAAPRSGRPSTTPCELRTGRPGRPFTVVFFTDGQPTVGETDPDKIVKNVAARTRANTRIFTFGVGDDVNAAMLDQLAEATRAVSTYVRPAEDIETKVASLYGKISHPVLTDLRLTIGDDVKLTRSTRRSCPTCSTAAQLVVIGRYTGNGPRGRQADRARSARRRRSSSTTLNFPEKTDGDREGLRRAALGAPQGRLPARSDSRQRREEGTDRRGGDAGQAVRHRDAVHELLVVPDAPDAGGPAAADPRMRRGTGRRAGAGSRRVLVRRSARVRRRLHGGLSVAGLAAAGLPGASWPTAPPPALTDPTPDRGGQQEEPGEPARWRTSPRRSPRRATPAGPATAWRTTNSIGFRASWRSSTRISRTR